MSEDSIQIVLKRLSVLEKDVTEIKKFVYEHLPEKVCRLCAIRDFFDRQRNNAKSRSIKILQWLKEKTEKLLQVRK
jgi:hypothetical protein